VIILDTNVVSELVRGRRADQQVRAWVRALTEQPVTTVVNRAELLAGVALLPAGHRRETLRQAVEEALDDLTVCLPFSADCATAYAEIVAVRTARGRPIASMDALIAAIASVHGAAVATRDVPGFEGVGLRVVDPWDS
jgi:predicted nucleic acid-binding protein